MDNILKILLKYGKEHPARVLDFTTLEMGLFKEANKGNININYHPEYPNLAIFKYSPECVQNKNWNLYTLMARGLILDLLDRKIVAVSFIKFFNFSEIEGDSEIIQSQFIATEKMDGSMSIIFSFQDQWYVATGGSFISEQAQWAKKWLDENINTDLMDKNNTYIAEIIYPENKIVVPYNFSGLVLLTIFDQYGLEYTPEMMEAESSYLCWRKVKQYNFEDMEEIVNIAKELPHTIEGFVVQFKNGVRLKVKGEEYVRIHRLISRVTPLSIWEALLENKDLEELKKDLPEELEKDFNTISSILNEKLSMFVKEVETMYENTKHMSDKDLGLYMQLRKEAFEGGKFPEAKGYIFLRRKDKFYESLYSIGSPSRRRIFNAFKPKSNQLENYEPSSVVNRFQS